MSTISHDARTAHATGEARMVNMWPSLAIAMIWLAVLLDALFGPNILTHDSSGNGATIPSAIVFALVAWPATRAIAKYGFEHDKGV